ncbi:MAG: alpha/beta hydrolase family protein [Saprospiraceae bacterium]|nr:alpha/beta hydrolase family protein [Saprospiraceae bacterium]
MRILCLMVMLISWKASAATIELVDVYSLAMQKQVRCMVVKPSGYSPSADPYPVLYLLHGWSGHFASWLADAPQLPDLADRYRMVVVCPDGGYDSWYLDSPVNPAVRYETFVSSELVQFVEYYYHVRCDTEGRFIAGLSMGGHGALYIALRSSGLFGAAASLAGGLDLRPFRKNDWDLQGVLGDPKTHWRHWESASVCALLDSLPDVVPKLMIDCGTEDFFLPVNRNAHAKLKERQVPHTYRERPGGHDHLYWGEAINDVFEWLK